MQFGTKTQDRTVFGCRWPDNVGMAKCASGTKKFETVEEKQRWISVDFSQFFVFCFQHWTKVAAYRFRPAARVCSGHEFVGGTATTNRTKTRVRRYRWRIQRLVYTLVTIFSRLTDLPWIQAKEGPTVDEQT